jgi:hypothetical protein
MRITVGQDIRILGETNWKGQVLEAKRWKPTPYAGCLGRYSNQRLPNTSQKPHRVHCWAQSLLFVKDKFQGESNIKENRKYSNFSATPLKQRYFKIRFHPDRTCIESQLHEFITVVLGKWSLSDVRTKWKSCKYTVRAKFRCKCN